MSYAPIQSETTLNHRNPVLTTHSINQNRAARSAATSKRGGGSRKQVTSGEVPRNAPLLVHSHLCWDWVWQRPQQFISRLSQRRKVLFVETVGPDPELAAPLARFRELTDFANITVLRLQFPLWR